MLYTKRKELLKARQEGRVITTKPRGLMDKAPAYGDCLQPLSTEQEIAGSSPVVVGFFIIFAL